MASSPASTGLATRPRPRAERMTSLFAALQESGCGIVSRVTPVHTAVRNCTRDEGGPFGAEGQYNRLPELAADLVHRHVSIIVTPPSAPAALAAKAATTTIPIVFGVGDDPVKLGLVTSLARPDGNATGVNFFIAELMAKRLGLLRELLPKTARIGVLANPSNVQSERAAKELETAARPLGLEIQVLNANNGDEIDAAFVTLAGDRPDALLVAPDM